MKRSDIKAGEAYYYDPQKDWQTARYGTGNKAVVVDDKRYRISQATYSRAEPYYEDPNGSAVLVDVHTEVGSGKFRVERKVVPASHLRGPWDAVHAKVSAYLDAEHASERAAAEQQKQSIAVARQVAERAAAAGVKADLLNDSTHSQTAPYFRVSVAEMTRILDLLAGGEKR